MITKNSEIDYSTFPYSSYSDIRIRNNEPLTYAYLNSHIVRLCSNLESLGITNTLQKATYEQFGTVKKATTDDILSESGNKTSVLTNKVINDATAILKNENDDILFSKGTLNFSKNYEFSKGAFVIGTNENVAKRITSSPENVVFTKLEIVPFGFDDKPFYLSRTDTTELSSFQKNIKSSGIVNFVDWNKPVNYKEFHVYYHQSGYVICNNSKFNDGQRQLKVEWIQLSRKH